MKNSSPNDPNEQSNESGVETPKSGIGDPSRSSQIQTGIKTSLEPRATSEMSSTTSVIRRIGSGNTEDTSPDVIEEPTIIYLDDHEDGEAQEDDNCLFVVEIKGGNHREGVEIRKKTQVSGTKRPSQAMFSDGQQEPRQKMIRSRNSSVGRHGESSSQDARFMKKKGSAKGFIYEHENKSRRPDSASSKFSSSVNRSNNSHVNIRPKDLRGTRDSFVFIKEPVVHQPCPEVICEEIVIGDDVDYSETLRRPAPRPVTDVGGRGRHLNKKGKKLKEIQPKVKPSITSTSPLPTLMISNSVDVSANSTSRILLAFPSASAPSQTPLQPAVNRKYPLKPANSVLKHRWLWQFIKELLDRKDPCMKWEDESIGIFTIEDMERLGRLWECYKKMTSIKAESWRQISYYFTCNSNQMLIQVSPPNHTYQFKEEFFNSKFQQYSYKETSEEDFQALEKMMNEIKDATWQRPVKQQVKLFCNKGCGSQFRMVDACQRHQKVCTFSPD